ncbi:rhodanese-like domain-containing protein [Acetivibrio saccincola]|uniref:rhodanese-like domain-containing protein n=1 Tax=Acetivibrio saccincola TaxID=1677857 RepID=UPI002355C4E5|nr:rhodanese-like domain-containing protein [Acetivibrio saccincola]
MNFGANGNYLILTEVDELDKLYLSNDPKLLFIDLRDSKDYEAGHIDKYINIPFSKDDKDTLLNFLEKNNYKDKTIVLMCYSSKRASEAFNLLIKNDYLHLYVVNINVEDLLNEYSNVLLTGPCNCFD